MLGKASVIKTRNQVKDIPVHQERVFSFITFPLGLLHKYTEKNRYKEKVYRSVQEDFFRYIKTLHHTKKHEGLPQNRSIQEDNE